MKTEMPILKPQYLGLAIGSYPMKAISFDVKKSKTGNEYVDWIMISLSQDKYKDLTISHYTPLEGKGSVYLKNFLMSINDNYDGEDFSPEEYLNKPVMVKVDYRKLRDGKKGPFPQVVDVSPINSGNVEATHES
jgi:hypothetical protein